MMMRYFTTAALAAALTTGVSGFSCQRPHASRTPTNQLMMSSSTPESASRRDILSNAASFAAFGFSALVIDPNAAAAASLRSLTGGAVTAQSAANKAAESYQGVYTDPNHKEGYRVIMASGKGAKMTLSDGAGDETYKNIPIGVSGNELSFDFSFKGGPKGVVAVLSDDKQFITFPDGNTWTKNANKFDGIYKDPKNPNGYRIIRKYLGENNNINFLAEINDTGNERDSVFVKGSHASLFSIPTAAFTFYDLPGTAKVVRERPTNIISYALQGKQDDSNGTPLVGQFSLEDSNTVFPYGTITFPDKTVWTRI